MSALKEATDAIPNWSDYAEGAPPEVWDGSTFLNSSAYRSELEQKMIDCGKMVAYFEESWMTRRWL